MRTVFSQQYPRHFYGVFLSQLRKIETHIATTKKSIAAVQTTLDLINRSPDLKHKKRIFSALPMAHKDIQKINDLLCTSRTLSTEHQKLITKNTKLCQKRADLFTKHFSPKPNKT